MIAILWTYEVRPEAAAAFESAYGPNGEWAALFRRSPSYLGTELLSAPGTVYLTIDRWRSSADFDAFMAAHRADYDALDRATESWTTKELKLGVWDSLGAP
ncbi:MAG TPA: antibiotic biosynthesis monooxygenase [Allosphingosinicella sp.]|nr:antibiotic biosynthesis monooxygenase [Allosphingosinicella sp.]